MGKRSAGEPAAPDLKENALSAEAQVRLSFVTPTDLTPEQAETFRKMIQALGLGSDEFELVVGDSEGTRGRGRVFLDSAQTEWLDEWTLRTLAIQRLVDDPRSRKVIWNDLKILLSRLERSE